MESRTPGDLTRPAGEGSAEVHSRVTNRTVDFTPATDIDTAGDQSTADRAKSRAQDVADQAKERAQQAGRKAGDAASQAQRKAAEAVDRAEAKLEGSGALNIVRNNPLPALGIAFGIGFLLAGSDDDDGEGGHGKFFKMKQQLKGAVVGGVSAAIAQEGRDLLNSLMHGGGESSRPNRSQRQGSGGGSQGGHRPPSHREMH